ncbi:MAG: S41 family peptidase [Planctomycetota bacterium]
MITTACLVCTACYVLHRRTRTAIIVGEAMDLIDRMYVEPVQSKDLLNAALSGMTQTLDPNSEFIAPRQYTSFQSSIEQEFAGIGIYIAAGVIDDATGNRGPVRVITPLVGSPALEAGLLPGDEIIKVDGEDVSGLDIEAMSERLRGPIGTRVQVDVRRKDSNGTDDRNVVEDDDATLEIVTLTVLRDTIELESVIGDYRDENNEWVYRLQSHPEIAYVRLTSFGDKTVNELDRVLQNVNPNLDGLILDLRGNGGGLLDAAVEVSDMFLTEGKIVSTRVRGGRLEKENFATEATLVDIKQSVAVLIDGNSASASEIVAAALQDNDRATIIGERSFGKGTVQQILPLQYGRSALRLTVAKYLRPNGRNIHRDPDDDEQDDWGVRPNPGYEISIKPEVMARLQQLWQQSSYPSLRQDSFRTADLVPVTSDASANDTNPTPQNAAVIPDGATAWDLDSVLQKAVEVVAGSNATVGDVPASVVPVPSNADAAANKKRRPRERDHVAGV